MKLTYGRHLDKVADRKWPRSHVFDDFKVFNAGDRIYLQCRHPNCRPVRDAQQRVLGERPKAAFDTIGEAAIWAGDHCRWNHGDEVTS